MNPLFLMPVFITITTCSTSFADSKIIKTIELTSSLKLSDFVQEQSGRYDSKDTLIFRNSNEDILKIRSINLALKPESEMTKLFQTKVIQFSTLFQDQPSPYGGAITNTFECVEKTIENSSTSKNNDMLLKGFTTKASSNFAYGRCDGADLSYFSKYYILLCKNNHTLYDIRYFTKSKSRLLNLSFKCIK